MSLASFAFDVLGQLRHAEGRLGDDAVVVLHVDVAVEGCHDTQTVDRLLDMRQKRSSDAELL